MVDVDVQNKFIELRARGKSYDKISQELSVSKPTLIKWGKAYFTEISNMKAIELEALQEKYFLTTKTKLENFGELITKINKDLASVNLSALEPDKILDMLIKCYMALKEESKPPVFAREMKLVEALAIKPDTECWSI